jgi:hypothetical protein
MEINMPMNPVIYMQVEMANLYIKQHNISIKEFLLMDEQYGIIDFIGEGYEPFHLMGNQGILNEIQEYIEVQDRHGEK